MSTKTILDDADLRTIRDALGAGKQVQLVANGSLEVSPEVVAEPMNAMAEAFIESQLGDVKSMVEQGFDITLHPAGQFFGASADGLTHVQGDLDKALGSDEMLTIRVVLGMGANVAVLPDGSVQTRHHLDQTPRSEQQVEQLVAALDAAVADGSLAAEARAGRALTIADTGDGQGTQLRFAQSAPEKPGLALPDDPPATDPRATDPEVPPSAADDIPEDPTGVDLPELAERLDARADALRKDTLEDQVAEASRVGLERDDAAREAWMNHQGSEAAWQQARRELKVVQEATKQVRDLEARAAADEAGGRHTASHVEGIRHQAQTHQARLDIARQRMESAEAEAKRLADAATENRNTVSAAEARLTEIETQSTARINFADTLEIQARQVRAAGEAMAAGRVDEARGWLADARVIGAGENDPGDLVVDEQAPDTGPITSPSQVDDGPITSPSQVGDVTDDVTGADQAPTVPQRTDPEVQDDLGTDLPAEQPNGQSSVDGAAVEPDLIEMPPDDLRAGLEAADAVEAGLEIDRAEPASDFAGDDPGAGAPDGVPTIDTSSDLLEG